MAIETDGERGLSAAQVLDQAQPVERALLAGNGTISIPRSEAELTSVDIADVDLLLSFTDGTFIVITNGALEAISETAHTVAFNDRSTSLDSLFKMVGISNHAKSGSLRVVSGNVDAPKTLEDIEAPQPPANDFFTSNDLRFSDRVAAPAPIINTGKGPGFLPVPNIAEDLDPVVPIVTPRPSVYRAGQEVPPPPSDPAIALDPDITADDIINGAEAAGNIPITGIATGSVKSGDSVNLMINGKTFTGLVLADGTFSINVPGTDLAADSDTTIDASVTIINEIGNPVTATDSESYTVNISPPQPTITLDANITADDIINNAEAAGNVTITGSVGGDAKAGDTVTLTLSSETATGNFTAYFTGLVLADKSFSIVVAGSALIADADKIINASITTYNESGILGTATDNEGYTVNITPPAPPVVTSDQIFFYAENRTEGNVVATVAATDDIGVNGYRFSDGIGTEKTTSADGYFTIGSDGQIKITVDGIAAGVNNFENGAATSFDYNVQARDAASNWSAEEVITLNVTDVDETINEPPTTAPVTLTAIAEDTSVTITQADLLSNALDPESGSLTASGLAIRGGSGTIVDNGNGTWTYTPALNDDTEVSFIYSISDGTNSIVGSATLDITTVNDAPTTTTVTLAAIAEDSGARLINQAQLLANAIDVEGDNLVASNLTITSGLGSLVDNLDGTWTYTPAANDSESESVSFSYTITDDGTTNGANDFKTATGSAILDITPAINQPPTTAPVTLLSIAEDSGVRVITQTELLVNSYDIDGDNLTANNLTASSGTLVSMGGGLWHYTPSANDDTGVSFTYDISDGIDTITTGSATLDITPVNDAPITIPVVLDSIAESSGVRVITEAELLVGASDIESDTLTVMNLGISSGSGTLVDMGSGIWHFTPASSDATSVIFSYIITDSGTTNGVNDFKTVTGSATLDITPVNDAPVANPDAGFTTNEDTAITILAGALTVNDTDAEGDPLTISWVGNAVNGSVVLNGDGSVTFTPGADYFGPASFEYSANDGTVDSAPATVMLTVDPVNDAPQTGNVTTIGVENSVSISITLTGTDIDGSIAIFTLNDLPTNGSLYTDAARSILAINGIGYPAIDNALTLYFVPNTDWNGTTIFTYAAIDDGGMADLSPGTAVITVTAASDAPVTHDVAATGIEDATAISITLTGTDANGSIASFALNDLPANGNLYIDSARTTLAATGSDYTAIGNSLTLYFEPNYNWNGTTTFTYAAKDDGGTVDNTPAMATLTVIAVNDAPVLTGDLSATVAEGTSYTITAADLGYNDPDDAATGVTFSVGSFINGKIQVSGADASSFTAAQLAAGNVTFVHDGSETLLASFNVSVEDGNEDGSIPVESTFNLTVTPVNDAPVAAVTDLTGSVTETIGTPAALATLTDTGTIGFSDADLTDIHSVSAVTKTGTPLGSLTASVTTDTTGTGLGGVVTWNYSVAASAVEYLAAGESKVETFSFDVSDSNGGLVARTIDVTITGTNDAPMTSTVILTAMAEDIGPRLITQTELLGKASDIDGNILTVNSVTEGSGALVNNGNGTWSYTPTVNDDSGVSFTYNVSDGTATVSGSATLDILPINDAPTQTAPVVLAAIAEDSSVLTITQAQLLAGASDIDGAIASLTVSNLGITSGSGSLVNNGNGTWDYTPALNDDTSVSFTYTITDNGITGVTSDPRSVAGSATLDIFEVNDTPETASIAVKGVEDAASISVTLSGTDVDGTVDSFVLSGLPANGTLYTDAALTTQTVLGEPGYGATGNALTLYFVPDDDWNGTTIFNYVAKDNLGLADATPGTATITVTEVNDAPTTSLVILSPIVENSGIRVITESELLAGASDIDDVILHASNLGISSGSGTLVDNLNGTWNYTPVLGDVSEVSFTYTITDNGSTSSVPDHKSVVGSATMDITPIIIIIPKATITFIDPKLNDTDNSSDVTFEFNVVPVGFEESDITGINGTIKAGSLQMIDSTHYKAVFIADDGFDGSGFVTIDAAKFTDTALIDNEVSISNSVTIDTKNPTVTITEDNADGTVSDNDPLLNYTLTFSEQVAALTSSDLTIAGGTLTDGPVLAGDGLSATFQVTADGGITGNLSVTVKDTVTDMNGNKLDQTTATNTLPLDTENPTVTINIEKDALGDTDKSSRVDFTFSEAPVSFDINDISFANGSISNLQQIDATHYQATFTAPDDPFTGAGSVSILASKFTDAALNSNLLAASDTVSINTFDVTGPTVAGITMNDYALKGGESALVTITFSESVDNFINTDLDLTNAKGTLTDVTSADGGLTWTATFTPAMNTDDIPGVITLNAANVADLAGNAGSGTTSVNYQVDTKSPTISTITMNDYALKGGESATVTITFSEKVNNFTNSDLVLTNAKGSLTAVSTIDGGFTWTATFTPATGTDNIPGVITLNAANVTDLAGNVGSDSMSVNYQVDTKAPAVTSITMSDSALKIGDTSLVTIIFSEAVKNFDNGDVTVQSGAIDTLGSIDGGKTWTATFTPTDGIEDTSNVVTIAATYNDLADNAGAGRTGTNYEVDTKAPTLTSITMNDYALKGGESATVTFTFSEKVNNFTNTDLDLTNAKGGLTAVSSADGGLTWTATFTPAVNTDDTLGVITLYAVNVSDLAGNVGSGTRSVNYQVDTKAPVPTIATVTVSGDDTVTIPESNLPVTITGTVGGDAKVGDTVSVTVNGKTFTEILTSSSFSIAVPGSDLVADSDKIVDVNISSTDAAGNVGTGSATKAFTLLTSFTGGDGDDNIVGNNANNSLTGGPGNDTLEGRGGADSLTGGGGNDTATYDSAPTGVIASLTSTYWSSQIGDALGDTFTSIENLTGSGHNDTLIGSNAGANILHGGEGDDILEGMAGADKLHGDGGSNFASYAHAPATLNPNPTSGITASLTDRASNTGHASGDEYFDIQNLIGSNYDDTLTGRDGEDNILIGGEGADALTGGTHNSKGDTASYVFASAVAGVIGITASLTTGLADVTIAGEAIGDTYSGIENLTGSAFNDTLIGDAVNNILTGGTGDDTLEGMAGADHFAGGSGSDTVSYAHAATGVFMDLSGVLVQIGDDVSSQHDGITATGGVVTGVDTYDSIENIIGSGYSDTLYGDFQNNTINGGAGNDTINGGAGNDTIDGGTGRDTIDGGLGNDTMTGGAGTDTIYANQGQDSAYGGDGNDTFYVSSLPANLPSVIDGGADDGSGGNIMVLQNLVNGSYTLAGLAGNDDRLVNIDTLNVKGDGAATAINISSTDVQNMVDAGTPASAQLIIKADSGDTLNLSASAVAAGETMSSAVHSDHIDYTILNASSQQVAQIHWQTA